MHCHPKRGVATAPHDVAAATTDATVTAQTMQGLQQVLIGPLSGACSHMQNTQQCPHQIITRSAAVTRHHLLHPAPAVPRPSRIRPAPLPFPAAATVVRMMHSTFVTVLLHVRVQALLMPPASWSRWRSWCPVSNSSISISDSSSRKGMRLTQEPTLWHLE
jgi:hypothetical protein